MLVGLVDALMVFHLRHPLVLKWNGPLVFNWLVLKNIIMKGFVVLPLMFCVKWFWTIWGFIYACKVWNKPRDIREFLVFVGIFVSWEFGMFWCVFGAFRRESRRRNSYSLEIPLTEFLPFSLLTLIPSTEYQEAWNPVDGIPFDLEFFPLLIRVVLSLPELGRFPSRFVCWFRFWFLTYDLSHGM